MEGENHSVGKDGNRMCLGYGDQTEKTWIEEKGGKEIHC